jgi:hypothetical protein
MCRLVCSVSTAVALAACVTPIRASNRSAEPDAPASVRFAGSEGDALTWLSASLGRLGYRAAIQYGRRPNTVYLFFRRRAQILAEGGIYWGRKGRAPNVNMNEPLTVGSVFYVFFQPTDRTETYVTLYGKPTIAGHELCDGNDARWRLPCEEIEAPPDWKGRDALDGAAEARVVRNVIADLDQHGPTSSASVATFSPPPTLEPPPKEQGPGCYWDYATGSNFQHLVCQGEDKTPLEQYQEDLIKNSPTVQKHPGDFQHGLGDLFGP